MKTKQFSFSIDCSFIKSKSKTPKNTRISPLKSDSSAPFNNALPIKYNSNKLLRYYSTKNKQSKQTIINEENIQIFQEQFKKFQELNQNKSFKQNKYYKKDHINLIAKRYYKSNVKRNFTEGKQKKEGKSHHIKQAVETREQETENDKFQAKQFQDGCMRAVQSNGDQQQIKMYRSQYPLKKYKNQDKQDKQGEQDNKFPIQNPQKYNFHDLQESARNIYQRRQLLSCPRNTLRRIMLKQQHLKKHKFNQNTTSNLQIQLGSRQVASRQHIYKEIASPQRLSFSGRSQRDQAISPNSTREIKTSKRYVRLNNYCDTPYDLQINPYTNKQYLHIKNHINQQQQKKLQKIIHLQYQSLKMVKQPFQVMKICEQSYTKRELQRNSATGFKQNSRVKSFMSKIKNNRKSLVKDSKAKGFDTQIRGWGQYQSFDQTGQNEQDVTLI